MSETFISEFKASLDKKEVNVGDDPLQHILTNGLFDSGASVVFVGVKDGRQVKLTSRFYSDTIYGVDNYKGLEEDWRDGYAAGALGRPKAPRTPKNVTVVSDVATYGEGVTRVKNDFVKDNKVGLLIIDSETYTPCYQALTILSDNLREGSIIVFDEIINYPGYEGHEVKALENYLAESGKRYEALAINGPSTSDQEDYYMHQRVAIRIFNQGEETVTTTVTESVASVVSSKIEASTSAVASTASSAKQAVVDVVVSAKDKVASAASTAAAAVGLVRTQTAEELAAAAKAAKAAEKEAAKAAKAAIKEAANAAKEAEKEAARLAKEAEKEAARVAKEAEKEAARLIKEAEKEAARAAKEAKKEAKVEKKEEKSAVKDEKKVAKASIKAEKQEEKAAVKAEKVAVQAEKKLTKKRRKSTVVVSRGNESTIIRSGSLKDISTVDDGRTRVKLVIPYGRKDRVECLLSYVMRDLDVFDEVLLWANTADTGDNAYLAQLDLKLPDKFRILREEATKAKDLGTLRGVYPMYGQLREDNTLYVKVDDDVVYVHEGAFRSLVDFALANKEVNTVFSGNVVNSGPMDSVHQMKGASLTDKLISYNSPYKILNSAKGARQVHASFCRAYDQVEGADLNKYVVENHLYIKRERWSINVVAFFGDTFTDLDHLEILKDDELYITEKFGKDSDKYAVVVGNSLFVHYAFSKQESKGFDDEGEILNKYRTVAALDPEEGGSTLLDRLN